MIQSIVASNAQLPIQMVPSMCQNSLLGGVISESQTAAAALSPYYYLNGKKILLGVSGSIAAYKAALVVRLLVKNGAEVRVIMTPSATNFVSPLTFSTLSKNEVITQFFSTHEGLWNNHVELGLWADAMLVAPATATTLAKMANGNADNVLVATYLSARCPVFIAPAMDLDMWTHPATQRNLHFLVTECKNHLIPVGHGELASGLVGDGRLAEPEQIVEHINQYFATNSSALVVNNAPPLPPQTLLGKTVLITAGPTYEPIDPVRFVGNRSTGKMGIAIAEAAAQMGAKVYLVLGETNLLPQNKDIQVISAHTAQAMYEATTALFPEANIAILSAAVADYTPVDPQKSKIKKTGNVLTINLQKTLDILASLGKNKKDAQLLVGFALETDNEEENARKKLQNKNLDLIVLNSLRDEGAGFRHDTNKICIIDKENNKYDYPLKTKDEVALDIMNLIVKKIPTSG